MVYTAFFEINFHKSIELSTGFNFVIMISLISIAYQLAVNPHKNKINNELVDNNV